MRKIKVLRLVEVLLPCLDKEVFTLTKDYKVAISSEFSYGKWPEALGSSFFMDSSWILKDLVDIIASKVR